MHKLKKVSICQNFSKKYKIISLLGVGAISKVYKARAKDNKKKQVAVKVYQKSNLHPKNSQNGKNDYKEKFSKMVTEIRVLRRVKHPNLLRMVTIYETLEVVYVVLELLKGPSITQSYVYNTTLSVEEIMYIMYYILKALKHMHTQGIVHRNLKPEGVILMKNGRPSNNNPVKLISYTHCGFTTNKTSLKRTYGTFGFIAPECFSDSDENEDKDEEYQFNNSIEVNESKKSSNNFAFGKQLTEKEILETKKDIWSLGALMYYFITQNTVFSAKEESYQNLKNLNFQGNMVLSHPTFTNLPKFSKKQLKHKLGNF